VIKAATPQQLQCRSTRDRQVTSTVLSVQVPPRPTAVVNPPRDTRQHGQCTRCLRAISLTAAGLVRSHCPNCSGLVSRPSMGPFPGFRHCVKRVPHTRPPRFRAPDSDTNVASSTPTWSSAEIVELLSLCRCQVLKRAPKESRIVAVNWLIR